MNTIRTSRPARGPGDLPGSVAAAAIPAASAWPAVPASRGSPNGNHRGGPGQSAAHEATRMPSCDPATAVRNRRAA
jgi:hypothetical protein